MGSGMYNRAKTIPFERFCQKYKISEKNCWEWIACRNREGYSWFWNGERPIMAHRWSYEYHKGKIPSGLVIDHLCRNPSCVNPEHLEAVPMKVNTERGNLYRVFVENAKKKSHCKRGHSLSGDNLRIDKRGSRMCKLCQTNKGKEWKRNNRDRVNRQQQERRKIVSLRKKDAEERKDAEFLLDLYKNALGMI